MTAPDPVETSHESWDAFWAEVSGPRTETVRGVTITVPRDLPLSFQTRLAEIQQTEDEPAVLALVADLFGDGALDQLMAAGMGGREFMVLVAWTIAQVEQPDLTFREAWERVQAGNPQGPAQNRAARRASSTRSGTGGGPSKPTTGANTTSGRKKSRA